MGEKKKDKRKTGDMGGVWIEEMNERRGDERREERDPKAGLIRNNNTCAIMESSRYV